MLNLVIFEDNPLVLKSLVSTISWGDLGCIIIGTAEDGEKAYTILSEHRIDIIISDIKMPGHDGLVLAKKAAEMGMDAKIILITGFHEFDLARQAVHLGVYDLLTKPVSNDDICASVVRAIEALKRERKITAVLPVRVPDDASSLVRHAVAYLDQHYAHHDMSLGNLAAKFQLTPSHLSRTIKKETGWGFVEILTEIRLNAAVKLLEQPNTKVYTAAEQAGFSDYPYFYQVFKKHYGVSPQQYRNRFL